MVRGSSESRTVRPRRPQGTRAAEPASIGFVRFPPDAEQFQTDGGVERDPIPISAAGGRSEVPAGGVARGMRVGRANHEQPWQTRAGRRARAARGGTRTTATAIITTPGCASWVERASERSSSWLGTMTSSLMGSADAAETGGAADQALERIGGCAFDDHDAVADQQATPRLDRGTRIASHQLAHALAVLGGGER